MGENEIEYFFNKNDFFALNELIQLTYTFNIRCSSERKVPKRHKKFFIDAPGRDGIWYTGDGFSIPEALDAWVRRVAEKNCQLRRVSDEEKSKWSFID
jgi:hypothetical protein